MKKIKNINYAYEISSGGGGIKNFTVEEYMDYTKRDKAVEAASQKLEEAKEALDNSKELESNLKKELKDVESATKGYDKVYNALKDAGKSYLTESNLSGINAGISCLDGYKEALDDSKIKVSKEKQKCQKDYDEAEKELERAKKIPGEKKYRYIYH